MADLESNSLECESTGLSKLSSSSSPRDGHSPKSKLSASSSPPRALQKHSSLDYSAQKCAEGKNFSAGSPSSNASVASSPQWTKSARPTRHSTSFGQRKSGALGGARNSALLRAGTTAAFQPPSRNLSEASLNSPRVNEEVLSEDEEKAKMIRLRTKVIEEIIKTESEYIDDLDVIIEVFLLPLRIRANEIGVSKQDIDILFSNVESLVTLNKQVLDDLQSRRGTGDKETQDVGDIFTKMSNFFKMYMLYCANHPIALQKLDDMKPNPKFARYLEIAQADSRCKGIQFGGYLIKPIQRLCKYPLLFRELLKQTHSEHPDYKSINEAKDKIDEVVDYINEGKRTAERQQKIVEVQSLMEDLTMELVAPTRRYVLEGSTILRHQITDNGSSRHLFLFNDLIVVAKETSKKPTYAFRLAMPLDKCRFIVVSEQEKISNAFEVVFEDKRHIFSTTTPKEQQEWVNAFKTLVKESKLKKLIKLKKEKSENVAWKSSTAIVGSPKTVSSPKGAPNKSENLSASSNEVPLSSSGERKNSF